MEFRIKDEEELKQAAEYIIQQYSSEYIFIFKENNPQIHIFGDTKKEYNPGEGNKKNDWTRS